MTTCRVRFTLLVILLLIPTAATGERTALHRAAQSGDAAKVKKLLEGGADVGARDEAGRTPRDLTEHKGIINLLDQTTRTETP